MKLKYAFLIILAIIYHPISKLMADDYVSGQLIIKPNIGAYTSIEVIQTELTEILATTNYTIKKLQTTFKAHSDNEYVYMLTLGLKTSDMEAVAKNIEQSLDVKYVEPNYVVESLSYTVDFGISGYKPLEYDLRYIAYIPTYDEIVVAIIDTGIEYDHDHLAQSIWINEGEVPDNGIDDDGNGFIDDWQGWDFTDYATTGGDNNPEPWEIHSGNHDHATQVAGIYASLKNDRENIRGLSPGVKLMNLKRGSSSTSNVYDSAVAIRYAADMGANIINCSFSNVNASNFLSDATKYAYDNDVLVFAAAGNNGISNSLYPANSEYAYGIGMYAYEDTALDEESSRGDFVAFAAPGVAIRSTAIGNSYTGGTGTSFSTPVIGALAAQIWMNNSSLSPDEVINKLIEYSEVLDDGGAESGYGKILYKELVESYVDISTYNVQAEVDEDQVNFEIEVVRQDGEVLKTVLNYLYHDGEKYSIHKELK